MGLRIRFSLMIQKGKYHNDEPILQRDDSIQGSLRSHQGVVDRERPCPFRAKNLMVLKPAQGWGAFSASNCKGNDNF